MDEKLILKSIKVEVNYASFLDIKKKQHLKMARKSSTNLVNRGYLLLYKQFYGPPPAVFKGPIYVSIYNYFFIFLSQ